MSYIYFFVAAILIIQIFRRRFDFFSIAAISFLLYTSNCITGEVWIEGGSLGIYYLSDIDSMTYLLIICQILIIILSMHIKISNGNVILSKSIIQDEQRGFAGDNEVKYTKYFWNALLFFSVFEFIYTILFQIGPATFFSYTRKGDIEETVGLGYSMAVWGNVLCFMYGIQTQRKKFSVISIILILITLILGSRAYLATSFVGYMVIKAKDRTLDIRSIIMGCLAFFLLLIYKNIYSEVRALDFESVIWILSRPEMYANMLDIGEFRVTASIYNYVVANEFSLPLSDSIARLVSILPFVNDYISTMYSLRFSTIAMNDLFGTTYGLASSFWAECYAMGGTLFLLIVTSVWLCFINWCNSYIYGRARMSPFVLTIASYCSFYIHRLDLLQVWGCFKSVSIFYFIWYVVNRFKIK